jgi:predicted ArsR family transcriptional regulator
MNMIEVNGLEVKVKLLETCETLEQNLIKAINKFVLKRIADLSKEIGDLFQGVQSKAESAEKLVEIEKNIEKIRASEFKKV